MTKPGERKLHILQTLAAMLENPKGEKITTAALAKKVAVSEAALYRHFASKAQMFEGLIEFIETSIFGLINQITASANDAANFSENASTNAATSTTDQHKDGLAQAHAIGMMLLSFAERNPGMTKVLIGEALVNEDPRLQLRMNQLTDRLELAFKQVLQQAAKSSAPSSSTITDQEIAARANLLVSFVVGRWHRFAKTGFKALPTAQAALQLAVLLR